MDHLTCTSDQLTIELRFGTGGIRLHVKKNTRFSGIENERRMRSVGGSDDRICQGRGNPLFKGISGSTFCRIRKMASAVNISGDYQYARDGILPDMIEKRLALMRIVPPVVVLVGTSGAVKDHPASDDLEWCTRILQSLL